MHITRYGDARRYDAPGHFEVASLRLQGGEASGAAFAWIGMSHILPGGGAEMASSPLEKIYVVLAGEIMIELGDGTVERLQPMDSCWIPGGETRAVRNDGNAVATMIVAMPHAELRT